MATKPAKKRAARKKTAVQTDRQRSSPPSEEKNDQIEGTEEETTESSGYQPQRTELENKDYDHVGAEEARQAELQAQRDEHNRRVGDASLRKAQREAEAEAA